jgi:hypothetical protein
MKKFALLVVGLAVILSGLVFAQDSDSSQATTLGPLS